MNQIKVNSHFIDYNNYTIDEAANFYLSKHISLNSSEKDIVVFNSALEETHTFSYESVYNYLWPPKNQDRISRFHVTKNNLFTISTLQNRVFVLDFKGNLLNCFYEKNEQLIDEFSGNFTAQRNHFAEGFFSTKDGRTLVLTYGYAFGRINQRGRFIIGISKEENPSFLNSTPFPTLYINDVWGNLNNAESFYLQNMDTINVKYPNIWHELDMYTKYEHSIFPLLLKNKEEYYNTLDCHKLGNPSRRHKSCHSYLMVNQLIDLDQNNILVTIFTDSQSKSHTPDKNTCYYFLIINKHSGEVIKDVSPNDTTIYKNRPMIVADDKKNNRLIFKTFENLFFVNYLGEIYYQISLVDKRFSVFRGLSYLGLENEVSFFFDNKRQIIYSLKLGTSFYDVEANILDLVSQIKKQKNI